MRKLPASFYNPTSLIGAGLSILFLILIFLMILIETFSVSPNPYIGILAFMVFPAFLLFGLFLIAFGMWREHRKRIKKLNLSTELPKIDFNDRRTLRATYIFVIGTFLLIVMTVFGSLKAYEYTESDQFCGVLCHEVMEPEYTAYKNSPHSKVGCVKCHIGPGADWFVKSKISGSYQVYSVLFNKYPRPIPVPVENLRPAQETCEQCHWPKHFLSEKRVDYDYYIGNENNDKVSLSMLIKIGGGDIESAHTDGIHWYMNIANKITYYASDKYRDEIPWVKAVGLDGKVKIFKKKDFTLKESEMEKEKLRDFDCIDCHNRPSHIYKIPDKLINAYISSNGIDKSLPFINAIAIEKLEDEYSTKSEALNKISDGINQFYKLNYPEIATAKKNEIEKSISIIQKIYSENYFPEMKVSWHRFPNNIGHTVSKGCFRCHDGNHISDDGEVISRDCNICHIVVRQTDKNGITETNLDGLKFKHPVHIELDITKEDCFVCHLKQRY